MVSISKHVATSHASIYMITWALVDYKPISCAVRYHHVVIKSPVIVKMSDYLHRDAEKMESKEQWYNSPLLAFEGGYRILVKVDVSE